MIPALYWDGMSAFSTDRSNSHDGAVLITQMVSIVGFQLNFLIGVYKQRRHFLKLSIFRTATDETFFFLILPFLPLFILLLGSYLLTDDFRILFVIYIIYSLTLLPLCLTNTMLKISQYGGSYIWKAYITKSVDLKKSCFFMPCSSNSILETDQSAAVFLGLLLFLAVEVFLPLYKRYKAKPVVKRILHMFVEDESRIP